MKKYAIITNQYEDSQVLAKKLAAEHLKDTWIQDCENPDFVFIIGGDGTFLRAVEKYNKVLGHVSFIPFKSGGVGFYTNHNTIGDEDIIIKSINNNTFLTSYFDALKIQIGDEYFYAVNEFKLINDLRAREAKVLIDDQLLQNFKGSGLIVATTSGSTGFTRSNGGSIIIPDLGLMQLSEVAPLNNNNYHSIKSPLIIGPKQKITFQFESKAYNFIIDTKVYNTPIEKIDITLALKKIRILGIKKQRPTKIELLRNIFIKDGEK